MASEVDICNLALSHIGQDANVTAISPPDGSFEADKCAAFYPMALGECLERAGWRFALTRAALTQMNASIVPPGNWTYAYGVPNGCVRALAVYLAGETDDSNDQPFAAEVLADGDTPVIYTNAPVGATLKFLVMPKSSVRYSPNFVIGLSYRLASYLAGPITKDLKLKKALYDVSEAQLLSAAALDGDSQKVHTYATRIPGAIAARLS